MGRVLTSSSEGLREVRFYVSNPPESDVKSIINVLKYVAHMGASVIASTYSWFNATLSFQETSYHNYIKVNKNTYKEFIKAYPPMVHFLFLGNHVNDDQFTGSKDTMKVA